MDFSRPKLTKSILQVRRQPYRTTVRSYQKKEENPVSESLDDLLVFGYASKLYPTDEHSRKISKNQHLIVWNDDRELDITIDRYDCRASLHDLSDFQTNSWNVTHQISEEENRIEEHLNEERYKSLYHDEEETKTKQEEEIKRLNAYLDNTKQYGEVGFTYDGTQNKSIDKSQTEKLSDDSAFNEKPFTAPKLLAVPAEMEIPPTEKMHAIIQKTAVFVSKQGTQMEIVLKTKQSNNSQFQFLDFGHYLNPYYRHMISRLKEGKYTPGLEVKSDSEDSNESSDSDAEYLHPSLFAASQNKMKLQNEEKTKVIRKIDPDHPLAKLIEKGKAEKAAEQSENPTSNTTEYYNNQQSTAEISVVGATGHTESNAVSSAYLSSYYDNSEYNEQQQQWPEQSYIVPPPPDLQPIVENMARQVATDGEAYEKSVLAQNNPTYSFLNSWHELYPYYQYRKQAWFQSLYSATQPTVHIAKPPVVHHVHGQQQKQQYQKPEPDEQSVNNQNTTVEPSAKHAPALPISFLIKSNKEASKKATLPASSFLEDEISDNDEQVSEKMTIDKPSVPTSLSTTISVPFSKTESPVVISSPPIFSPAFSPFNAVTPTGKSASISNLREKQAERRQRALLFLKAKHNQEPSKKILEAKSDVNQKKLASEDIFDLSDTNLESETSNTNGLSTTSSSRVPNANPELKKNYENVQSAHIHSSSLSPNQKRKRASRSLTPTHHHSKESSHESKHRKKKSKKKDRHFHDDEYNGGS